MKNSRKFPLGGDRSRISTFQLSTCQGLGARHRRIPERFPVNLRRILVTVAVTLFACQAAWANGGTFATSSVYSTGNLLPERKQKIELVDELLEVSFDGDWATVNVTYKLQNHGGADSMTYGFPVDATPEENASNMDGSIGDFTILDGGKQLDISKEIKMPKASGDYTEQPYSKLVRDWFFTTLNFTRRETKTLAVRYQVMCSGTRTGTSKSIFWEQSPRTFNYTFKPADTWGNGRLHHLEIVVDTTKLHEGHIPINSVQPSGSQDENGILHWNFTDVQLSKAPDLVINYDNSARQMTAQANALRIDPKWIRSVRASSTHAPSSKASYDVTNLLDHRLDTAWIPATRGTGDGEWIEVTFKKPIDLRAVGIVNGYLKSAQLLGDNGRVSKAGIHVYAVKGEDWNEDVDLNPTPFPTPDADPVSSVQWVYDSGDSHIHTKRFRLTIKKAQAGGRYPDTAISELCILGSPDPAE